jgi:4-amino-4-deoxy-L-arabinose transferase-like glycosyltransferase
MIAIGLLAYATLWAAYRFRYDWITPPSSRSSSPWWDALLPRAYLQGLADLFMSRRRPAFLMGDISADGWWYYFIVTFLLKTSLPLLLLFALASVNVPQWWRKNPVALLFLIIPVIVYFGIASASRFNIGHRHILPIYPFLFVLAGSLVPWVRQQRALLKGGVGLLIVWYIVSSLSIFPHYLAYFNELAGGPENGYKYLIDSNLDWGQDLKGLKRYMEEHRIERVWLKYFGTASPDYYGIAYNVLPTSPGFATHSERETPRYVAISVSLLQGEPAYFEEFRRREPIAKIGYSIFLYRLD